MMRSRPVIPVGVIRSSSITYLGRKGVWITSLTSSDAAIPIRACKILIISHPLRIGLQGLRGIVANLDCLSQLRVLGFPGNSRRQLTGLSGREEREMRFLGNLPLRGGHLGVGSLVERRIGGTRRFVGKLPR